MKKLFIFALVVLTCCSPEKSQNTPSTQLADFIEGFQLSAGRGRLLEIGKMPPSLMREALLHEE